MFKACGLDSGIARLYNHPIRTVWAPRTVRSFATAPNVSGHQHAKSSPEQGRQNRSPFNQLGAEKNELRSYASGENNLKRIQLFQRHLDLETEDGIAVGGRSKDSFSVLQEHQYGGTPPKARDDVMQDLWDHTNEDANAQSKARVRRVSTQEFFTHIKEAPSSSVLRGHQYESTPPKVHNDSMKRPWDDTNEDTNTQKRQTTWKGRPAHGKDQRKHVPKREPVNGLQEASYWDATAHQEFHKKLHQSLLKNIMRNKLVLRSMPVFDSTFEAVASGRDLFVQSTRSVRSLAYLLPITHKILEFGVWKRRREVKPDSKLGAPSSLLILCPTLPDAQAIHIMGSRLLKDFISGMDIMVLGTSAHYRVNRLKTEGSSVLISTPEVLLEWLGLAHVRPVLLEAVKDVQTLVVDGEARAMRRGHFLELLRDVLKDMPLGAEAQRVIVSDEHDAERDAPLTKLVFRGEHDFHLEPRVEEMQEIREAQAQENSKQLERKALQAKKRREKGKLAAQKRARRKAYYGS